MYELYEPYLEGRLTSRQATDVDWWKICESVWREEDGLRLIGKKFYPLADAEFWGQEKPVGGLVSPGVIKAGHSYQDREKIYATF